MKQLKAFISYSYENREVAAAVRAVLEDLDISCFVAHDDLHVSEVWKKRILSELAGCNVFVALLSKEFKESKWAPKELGFAVATDALIIPIRLDDTVPFGFIEHLQGGFLVAPIDPEFFIAPILSKLPKRFIPALIKRLSGARSFRQAEAFMRPLVPVFTQFTEDDIDLFIDGSIENSQIWDAGQCSHEYIPAFIEANEARIKPDKLRRLKYLIENGEQYPDYLE